MPKPSLWKPSRSVALLAEGVDRNAFARLLQFLQQVALLAEGVDRNPAWAVPSIDTKRSPSSRRAWIEILPEVREWIYCMGRPPRGGRG